jgi:hypothetical protein
MTAPPSVPTVWIRLEFEGSPAVLFESCAEGDVDRLLAWLRNNPRLLALVGDASEIQSESEALRR